MTTKLIIPTAEPFFIPGGKIGCLLIHGFTGTPKEMRNLADSLTLEKYTILGIRLAGHATDLEDMRHSTWRDWLASVEDGINLLKGCTDPQVGKGKPDWRNLEAMKNHVDYPAYPTRSVLQLKKLIDVMVEELPHVKVPALLVQSRTDHGIPAESLEKILNRISSTDKSKLWVENSGHVIIREPEREMIFTEVKKFIKRITQ